MDYKVVFDITEAGYQGWTAPIYALIVAGAGAAMIAVSRKLSGVPKKITGVLAFLVLGLSLVFAVTTTAGTYLEYSWLADAAVSGRTSVVEGAVTRYKLIPTTGNVRERFCVQSTCFEYSDDVVTGAFHKTSRSGGLIREGLPVRVTYVGTSIVRLEVVK